MASRDWVGDRVESRRSLAYRLAIDASSRWGGLLPWTAIQGTRRGGYITAVVPSLRGTIRTVAGKPMNVTKFSSSCSSRFQRLFQHRRRKAGSHAGHLGQLALYPRPKAFRRWPFRSLHSGATVGDGELVVKVLPAGSSTATPAAFWGDRKRDQEQPARGSHDSGCPVHF